MECELSHKTEKALKEMWKNTQNTRNMWRGLNSLKLQTGLLVRKFNFVMIVLIIFPSSDVDWENNLVSYNATTTMLKQGIF